MWTAAGAVSQANSAADPGASMWFLTYLPYALLHGHNPLFASIANAPYGVNVMNNTSALTPALLVAPVTLLFGPATAYVTAMTLAFATSATAAYLLLRRWTYWRAAAFVGALAYGFSPYMIGQGSEHLNLVFVPIPPLILLVLDELLVRHRARPELLGVLLGGLVVAQYFTSTEILATSVVMTAIGLAVAALLRRQEVRSLLVPTLRCGIVAAAVSGAVLAYPLWVTLDGPARVSGPLPIAAKSYRADLAATVVPSRLQAIVPAGTVRASSQFVDGGVGENGAYLGIPLLLAVVGTSLILWRKRIAVSWAACMFLVSLTLSLGARLVISGRPSSAASTGLPLPEAILNHIPLGANILPIRFSLYTALFAGILLASLIDAVWQRLRRGAPAGRAAGALTVAVIALVPLLPAWPEGTQSLSVPRYFTSRGWMPSLPGPLFSSIPIPRWG